MGDKVYETGLIGSFSMFIALGLEPGSFSMACIRQDRDLAYRCAHPHLKKNHTGQDVVANMLEWVTDNFPNTLLDDQQLLHGWSSHRGLLGADVTIRTQMRLECGRDPWFMKYVREDALDDVWALDAEDRMRTASGVWLMLPRR